MTPALAHAMPLTVGWLSKMSALEDVKAQREHSHGNRFSLEQFRNEGELEEIGDKRARLLMI